MAYRIFLAGASGAIGRHLTPLLHNAGQPSTTATQAFTTSRNPTAT
jgi:nucleoside-diphosphate-sugar epimerase